MPVYKVNIKQDLNSSAIKNKRKLFGKSTYMKNNLDNNLQIPEEEKMHHQSSKVTEQVIEYKKQDSDGNYEDSSEGSDEPVS